ncbi:helix-turn-helix transcriptional regulator [Streptomyces sp. NPDC060205]|uniref:helix-turn-helix transcriptional regulator n=1 Tax=Streptomyces sp. NPDC060205 TaxID=3347072 RepID=UPI003649E8A0
MHGQRELADFLQNLRARLRPEDIGLPDYGDRRRVPGLRREELAQLAGVSSSYYTRLEQGHAVGASPEVLDALAQALRLDEAERHHLHDLAQGARRRPVGRRPPEECADASTLELLESLGDVPTLVSGRRGDVLAWNAMGHALFAPHLDFSAPQNPDDRPNLTRLIFLDTQVRALYAAWADKARAVVQNLRMVAGRHPDDDRLASLIGELSTSSTEFASMWADHSVRPCESGVYEMHHPWVGAFMVAQQSLQPPQNREFHLVLATAPRDSASQSALRLLAQTVSAGRAAVANTTGPAPAW